MFFDTSIQTLTLAWNEKRFNESRSARNAARRSIFRAATVLLNSELKTLGQKNDEIQHEINRCQVDLQKYDNKLQILDNMTQLATQSLEVYFQARMENLRSFVAEQCRVISDSIQEEADHWKEIHAMLQQKLVVPGDLRSYGGGNGLPRPVRQSPGVSQIVEEDEEEDDDEEEEERNKTHISMLLQSRTLTPLITETLKKARLLASKLSQNTSQIIPSELSISKCTHEETVIDEVPLPPPVLPSSTTMLADNHVTLGDVSAIEKAVEIEHEIPHQELSVSLLPCMPTAAVEQVEEEKQNNKSIASTISDKTFVKTSLKQFSSDEETDDDDDDEDDDTMVEDSLVTDNIENTRPLLLTADRSIRRIVTPLRGEKKSISNPTSVERMKIKQEKVSFREPLPIESQPVDKITSSTNSLIEIEKPIQVRSTFINNQTATKLSPIKSEESNEQAEEQQVGQIHESLEKEAIEEKRPAIIEQMPIENSVKTRNTRRATIRILRETQNDSIAAQAPIEVPTKTRYATRYSTRLAAAVTHEDIAIARTSTVHRRTTRYTSD